MKTGARAAIATIGVLLCILLAGCGKDTAVLSGPDAHRTGSLELRYATQFEVEEYEEDYRIVRVADGLGYLLIPPGKEGPPAWMSQEQAASLAQIRLPLENVYLAASSAMDLVSTLDRLDAIRMTSTKAADWGLPEIRERVESDSIHYVGKYSAPDYEALLEEEVQLAVESTMIYHAPQIKEELEALGIPVLVERSSYENDPLGRLEWIRLYGVLLDREDEADRFFSDVCARLEVMTAETGDAEARPRVAFFSINANGAVTVRKPGDYVTKMIEMAGGEYALSGVPSDEENALSTMNMQMEAFYEAAVDADVLIYNSAIEGDLGDLDALLDKAPKLADFRAVKEGRVWCTYKNVYQRSGGICDMILDMHRIFQDSTKAGELEYFHKL